MSHRGEAETKIYLERSGINAAKYVEALMAEPEAPLDHEERELALAFESELADTELSSGKTLELAIKNQQGTDVVAPYVALVSLAEGKVKSNGIEIPALEDPDEAHIWLASQVAVGANGVQLRQIAKTSMEDFKSRVADMLVSGAEPEDDFETPTPVVVEPEILISQTADMNEARSLLLAKRSEFGRYATGLDGAKRVLVDVYLARVNNEIAKNIPMLECLLKQSIELGDQHTISAINELLPPSLLEAIETPEAKQRFFVKLDFLRNGASQDQSKFSALSPELELIGDEESTSESLQPAFTPEEVARLKEYMIEPEQALIIIRRIIARAGLLSRYEPDETALTRNGRAPDNLLQVVINPNKDTYAVNGTRGLYLVGSRPASLYKLLVTAGAHELEHINQSEADLKAGESLRIANILGKRVSMLREAGANRSERELEHKLFGRRKPVALTYAKALQELESEGSYFGAASAFYKEKMNLFPDIEPATAARDAVDRVLRLTLFGGHNSQPLVYAEAGIMQRELARLPVVVQSRATAITGLDLVDQTKLHKFGLLPQGVNRQIDWSQFIVEESQELIDQVLTKDQDE